MPDPRFMPYKRGMMYHSSINRNLRHALPTKTVTTESSLLLRDPTTGTVKLSIQLLPIPSVSPIINQLFTVGIGPIFNPGATPNGIRTETREQQAHGYN